MVMVRGNDPWIGSHTHTLSFLSTKPLPQCQRPAVVVREWGSSPILSDCQSTHTYPLPHCTMCLYYRSPYYRPSPTKLVMVTTDPHCSGAPFPANHELCATFQPCFMMIGCMACEK